MYFSMVDMGIENTERINTIGSESDKWRFIYDTAKNYGFEGIHFGIGRHGLDLNNMPDYFQEFKLTLHFDKVYNQIISQQEYDTFNKELSKGFEIALKHKMHDISLHPPGIDGFTIEERKICEEWFDKAIAKWVREALLSNISLSLETHVTGEFFLFNGLREYAKFIDRHPNLGVLIDITHNYYDNFSEDDIINILGDKNVKGLHISDALQNVEFRKGTHLAIGEGTVNFEKLLEYFDKIPNLYGALEINANNESIDRSLKNLNKILNLRSIT